MQGIIIGFDATGKPIYADQPTTPAPLTGRGAGPGPVGTPPPSPIMGGRATGAGAAAGQQAVPVTPPPVPGYNPAGAFVGGRGNLGALTGATDQNLQIGDKIRINPETGLYEIPTGEGNNFNDFVKGASNFVGTWASDMNPKPLLDYLFQEREDNPLTAAFMSGLPGSFEFMKVATGLGQAQIDELKKAKEAYDSGNEGEAAARTLAGITPLIGPAAAMIGDKMAAGDTSGALGSTAALLTPVPGLPMAGRAVDAVRRGLSRTRLPTVLERSALTTVARSMMPAGGANRIKFSPLAQKAAPEILNDPGMMAWSKATLKEKVDSALEVAAEDLDKVYDSVPDTRMYDLAPMRKAIADALDKLTVKGRVKATSGTPGTVRTSSILGPDGQPITTQTAAAGADLPTKILPSTQAEKATALQQALDEIDALGTEANTKNILALARSWGKGAKSQYIRDATADAFKLKETGAGYADAEQVLRDFLANKNPDLKGVKEANARYSTYKAAADVLQAAEDFEIAKGKGTGRSIALTAAGTLAGGAAGGPGAAILGGSMALLLDQASRADVTTRFAAARGMNKLAQAIRKGSSSSVEASMLNLARKVGVPQKLLNPAMQEIRNMFGRKGKGGGPGNGSWKPKGESSGVLPFEPNPDTPRPPRPIPQNRVTSADVTDNARVMRAMKNLSDEDLRFLESVPEGASEAEFDRLYARYKGTDKTERGPVSPEVQARVDATERAYWEQVAKEEGVPLESLWKPRDVSQSGQPVTPFTMQKLVGQATKKTQLQEALRVATSGADDGATKSIPELRKALTAALDDVYDPEILVPVQEALGYSRNRTVSGNKKYTVSDLNDISDASLAGRVQEIQAENPGITPIGIVKKLNEDLSPGKGWPSLLK